MLITAGRILTEATGEYLTDGAVLVKGDSIVAVGPRKELEDLAPEGTPHLDFPESTLLPGLIDCHVHLVFDGSADPTAALQQAQDDDLFADMAVRAEQLLGTGVTTARDLGDRNGLAVRLGAAIAEGVVHGPRIVSAGTPVTPKGGHCWFLGGEAEGEAEVRALVQRNAANGATAIKAMVTGGGLTKGGAASWENQFSAEELTALVDEAHKAGLPVAAHAHGTDGIAAAVAAGVDSIEHCTWMTETGFELRKEVLDEILAKGIHVCPAVSQHWQMLPRVFGQERADAMFGLIREMADAGVKLVAGTDAGVQRAGFGGLISSLAFYAHLGLPNSRIIDMATAEAARALGLGDQTGRLVPSYKADLLIVDGDPLEDLGALSSVRTVIAAGKRYQPKA
ncbi:amidohydrolase family protein [Streptomyces sp. NPDC048442]|uniref:amidohydrolase family protein n=1 Tax=Streptomyces sp. NPDC048442 TaxID=3154823 RepID=UPI003441E98E